MTQIKQLSDDQTDVFDQEYVTPLRRQIFDHHFAERFNTSDPIEVLDVGGGNGLFADSLLAQLPQAKVTILDNSQQLLNRNTISPRKDLVLASATELHCHPDLGQYDLICLHWVLHHFVGSTHKETTNIVEKVLTFCQKRLKSGGRISVFENMYNGIWWHNLPSHIIFGLTASRLLAPITKRMGANTAGVGVCFRSRENWSQLFTNVGLTEIGYQDALTRSLTLKDKLFLHMGYVRVGHVWLNANIDS